VAGASGDILDSFRRRLGVSVMDAHNARRLAGELLANWVNEDARGIAGFRLLYNEFTAKERAAFEFAVQSLAAAAIRDLARIYECEPRQVVERLGGGSGRRRPTASPPSEHWMGSWRDE
jgi:hypothetical protein